MLTKKKWGRGQAMLEKGSNTSEIIITETKHKVFKSFS